MFGARIVALSTYAKNPRSWSVLFHISDTFLFGLSSDLLDLWDIPLQSKNSKILAPEQYIWTSFLKKKGYSNSITHMLELSPRKIIDSELLLVNNFVIVNPEMADIVLDYEKQKITYQTVNQKLFYDLYFHQDWLYLYHKCCFNKQPRISLYWITTVFEVYFCSLKYLLPKLFYQLVYPLQVFCAWRRKR